jgi:hypothetical protein
MPDATVFRLRSNMPDISYKIHAHFETVKKTKCVCVCVVFFLIRRYAVGDSDLMGCG